MHLASAVPALNIFKRTPSWFAYQLPSQPEERLLEVVNMDLVYKFYSQALVAISFPRSLTIKIVKH